MADGRQRAAWSHTVAVAVGFAKAMGAKGPGILDMIPERYKAEAAVRSKSAEEEEAEAAFGFAGLEAGLRGLSSGGK